MEINIYVGCGITEQTIMMTFSKVRRSKILGEIKRQGEKKKLPSHIREQTRGQRGLQMSDRFDNLQVAFTFIYYRFTGQTVTEAERKKHTVLHSSSTPTCCQSCLERTAVFR